MSESPKSRRVADMFETPTPPNFLRIAGAKSDSPTATVDVRCIPDSQLRRIAKRWTDALIENARKRRGHVER